jgi:hypothetical protein
MTNLKGLFSAKDNKPESKYGSTRSTLFGKFYERIIAKWLEEEKDYEPKRWPNGAVHKPRIYWNKISLDNFSFAGESTFETKVRKLLQSHRSHCTPDGLFERKGKSYIWEAKNWPLYPEKGPESQIWNYFSDNPWILARTCDYEGDELEISGFLFSFWDMEIPVKKRIENKVKNIIGENRFEIICTKEIMKACIQNQYDWYVQIIKQEKNNIDDFFDRLLGKR